MRPTSALLTSIVFHSFCISTVLVGPSSHQSGSNSARSPLRSRDFRARADLSKVGKKDLRRDAPWVAGIFQRDKKNPGQFNYLCGATLISEFILLTTASCVHEIVKVTKSAEPQLTHHRRYTNLRVLAGIKSTNYSERDEFSQEAEVGMIREHRSRGEFHHTIRQVNLAAVRLKVPFNLTSHVNYVNVVEIPNSLEELLTTRAGEYVTLAGFNQPKPWTPFPTLGQPPPQYDDDLNDLNGTSPKMPVAKLEIRRLKLLKATDCIKKYEMAASNFNVVCAQKASQFDPNVPCFMEGHGMIVQTDGETTDKGPLYVMGVYTSNSAKFMTFGGIPSFDYSPEARGKKCEYNDVIHFTKYGEYPRWAISHMQCDEKSLQCEFDDSCEPLEKLCNGKKDCYDGSDESHEICNDFRDCDETEFRCRYGACIPIQKMCNGRKDCADSSDEENHSVCRIADIRNNITCPPIPLQAGVLTKCALPSYYEHKGGSEIPCDGVIPVNTELLVSCDRYFVLLDEHWGTLRLTARRTAICQRDGRWSDNITVVCKPDCGVSDPPRTAYIIGGTAASNHAQFPWHAAIFRRVVGDTFSILCGGTLISSNIILTAAHCLTRDGDSMPLNPADHKVFLSKNSSNFYDRDQFSQEMPIERFIIEDTYRPYTFEADIALIILSRPVEITTFVRPVCVPLPQDAPMTDEQFESADTHNRTAYGTVLGFGLNENKTASLYLKKLEMPIVPNSVCQISLAPYMNSHMKNTWVCAGHTDGQSVCQGDSGGGLVFPYTQYYGRVYYVQGIVSHGPFSNEDDPCLAHTFKIFTKVQLYSHWIHTWISNYEPDYKTLYSLTVTS